MKIKLTTNKFNEKQLRNYMKTRFKWRDEWIELLVNRIGMYYPSYDFKDMKRIDYNGILDGGKSK